MAPETQDSWLPLRGCCWRSRRSPSCSRDSTLLATLSPEQAALASGVVPTPVLSEQFATLPPVEISALLKLVTGRRGRGALSLRVYVNRRVRDRMNAEVREQLVGVTWPPRCGSQGSGGGRCAALQAEVTRPCLSPGFSSAAQSCPLGLRSAQGIFRPEAQTTGPKGPSPPHAGPWAPADAHASPGQADLPPGCQPKDQTSQVSFSLSGGPRVGVCGGSLKLPWSWKDRRRPPGSWQATK